MLDAQGSRLLLGRHTPRAQTLWWDHAAGAVSTLANQGAYFADIRGDRFATLTGDPYRGGCSTLRADGLGPNQVSVRGDSGRLLAGYRVDGWIGRIGFESNRALLFDAVGSHRQAVARCTVTSCQRASETRPRPLY